MHGQIQDTALAEERTMGLGSSGLEYNESYILSRWPRLENHGHHFRSKDVDFDAEGDPRHCIG